VADQDFTWQAVTPRAAARPVVNQGGESPVVRASILLALIAITVIEGGVMLLSGMVAKALTIVVVGAILLTSAAIALLLVNRRSQI
jgi:hypothetical protein